MADPSIEDDGGFEPGDPESKTEATNASCAAVASVLAACAAIARALEGCAGGLRMAYEVNQDWYFGDDPGMTAWAVCGADGALLTALKAAGNCWSVVRYDMSLETTPRTPVTPDSNGAGTVSTGNARFFATPQLDGYWTRGGAGYNFRHYIRHADYTTVPIKEGHEYRFVYTLNTEGQFDDTTNNFGDITLVRTGKALSRA